MTPKEQAQADAIAMVRKYYAVTDKLERSSISVRASTARLRSVATLEELTLSIKNIETYRSRGLRNVGSAIRPRQLEATSVDLKFGGTPSRPKLPTVTVTTCLDVSGLDVIDKGGKSVVASGRLDRSVQTLKVSSLTYPQRSGWRVAQIRNNDVKC